MNRIALGSALAFWTAVGVSAELEEVVVNAQRRLQDVQTVPIAISSFSAEDLIRIGATNVTELSRYAPGMESHANTISQPHFSIRGIRTVDFTAGSDTNVAVYVDGVYAARIGGTEIPFTDIERVEVLRGPQGTLFGRNATGGAINIHTKSPTHAREFDIRLKAGNYGRQDLNFVLNQPVRENFAVRISGSNREMDGWIDNSYSGPDLRTGASTVETRLNGEDTQTVRISALWEPSERTRAVLRYENQDTNQTSGTQISLNRAISLADPFGPVENDTATIEARELSGWSLHIDHEWENLKFSSVTAKRNFLSSIMQDEDGSASADFYFASGNTQDSSTLSQEFQLSYVRGDWQWVAGAIFSEEDVEHTTEALFTLSSLESFAAFETVQDNPGLFGAPAGLTADEYGEFVPAIRAANRARGADGIVLSSFVAQLMATTPDPFAMNPSHLYNVPVALNACGNPIDTNAGVILETQLSSYLQNGLDPASATLAAITDVAGCAILPFVGPRVLPGVNERWDEAVFNAGDYSSSAIYGDVTYAATDSIDLTFGIRFSDDEKDFLIRTAYQNFLIPGLLPAGVAFYNNGAPALDETHSDSWSNVSGRFLVSKHLFNESMLYFGASTGFKAGGFNSLSFAPGVDPSFEPEEIVSYELGWKSVFNERSMLLNASLFSWDYDNLQSLSLVGSPIPSYNLRNQDARGRGLELEYQWASNTGFNIWANYSLLDTEVTAFDPIAAVGETPAEVARFIGQPLSQTPKSRANIFGAYSWATPVGEVTLRMQYSYVGERRIRQSDPRRTVDSYGKWDMRLWLKSLGDSWRLGLFADNLTDEEIFGGEVGPAEAIGAVAGWRFPPRMYGLEFTFRGGG